MEVAVPTPQRAPSPDSACGDEWAGGAICGHQEEATSDMSEESSGSSGKVIPRRKSDSVLAKGISAQDSDVDSGIVAYGKPGQRIGSTSSADTDSSQETRRKIEYSPPLQKNDICKSRVSSGSLRVPKYPSTNGPIKGDHLILKECNRRPPTPLTVFPESHHCVRFDEQLQLSEQNIRRSCRKLFATLYAQRFSYPSKNENCQPLPGRLGQGSTRIRSRTAPELELRRYSPVSVDGRHARSLKQDGRRVATPVWNGREMAKPGVDFHVEKALPAVAVQRHLQSTYPFEASKERAVRTTSTDSGIGHFAEGSSQCTCLSRQTSVPLSSSQPYRCCNCVQTSSRSQGLYKSSSCSTLSSALIPHQSRPQLTQFPPRNTKKPLRTESPEAKLQKTSSCSNLLDRTIVSNVPVYSDNMVQAYAHIASVIPEDSKTPQTGRRPRSAGKRQSVDHIYDTLRSSASTSSGKSCKTEPTGSKTNILTTEIAKDLEGLRPSHERKNGVASMMSCDSTSKSVSSDIYSQIGEVGNQSISSVHSQYERIQGRSYSQRPKSVGVVVPNPVYLKSALKKPTQSALQNVNDSRVDLQQGNLNGYAAEVEYAVVDKSKKNKFASLPALNGNAANSNRDNDEKDHPPVPPKKFLNKSDFSLYRSRSASPKKTLLERMQSMGRNARSALQKAFSTERIYRPEKEERMEAGEEKPLQRSRSFIKGLTSSFRRKKRKPRSGMTEVVTQQSPVGPEWEENPSATDFVRGQLLQLNVDGSQVVELTKPTHKPYGFFVARGRVRNSKGVFVSRMRDQETQKQLAGLLDIGDEILEIDGYNVKTADIMEVNNLMANKNTLLLTVLPYICRKDI